MNKYKKIYGSGASYPVGVSNIRYASYLEITKYKYNSGLKAAYDNGQRDVAASFGQNSIVQAARKVVNESGKGIFGGVDETDYDLSKLNADIIKDIKESDAFNKEERKQIRKNIANGDYSCLLYTSDAADE